MMKDTKMAKTLAVVAAVVLLAQAVPASATPVTVVNGSFELPDLGFGGYDKSITPTGWTVDSSSTGLTDKDFLSTLFPNFGSGPEDGDQYGTAWTITNGYWSLTSSSAVTTIADDVDYTFTMALGNSGHQRYIPLDYSLSILANDVPVATLDVLDASTVITAQTFQDFSVVLDAATVADQGLAGQELKIRITNHTNSTHYYCAYDNARLDATAVPEPATMAMLGLGGVMMLIRRRRCR